MKSSMTTLCYIEKGHQYLMLHRVSKENDINKDKWIGVGGHFEGSECPEECLCREVYEETGLTLTAYRFRGLVTFVSEDYPVEYMCLYTASGFEGKLLDCDEGKLEWVDKDKLADLNLWDGDYLFLDLLRREQPFFSLKLCYDKAGVWQRAVLDGRELELFDLCDAGGNVTGRVVERGMAHRYGLPHRTVHIWIIRKRPDGGVDVLLQKRSENKDGYPGCYDISSAGHVRAGDDYMVSALRELSEELGMHVGEEELRFIGYHQGYVSASFWGEPFLDWEVSAVYLCETPVDIDSLRLQESEVDKVVFLNYNDVLAGIASGSLPNCIYPREFEMIQAALVPGYSPDGVWVVEDCRKQEPEIS